MIFRPGERPDRVPYYNEEMAQYGRLGSMRGDQFIRAFLQA